MIAAPKETASVETTFVRTHGHLALLEWEQPVPAAAPPAKAPIYRRTGDRWYAGGTLLLLFTTIAALVASLCH